MKSISMSRFSSSRVCSALSAAKAWIAASTGSTTSADSMVGTVGVGTDSAVAAGLGRLSPAAGREILEPSTPRGGSTRLRRVGGPFADGIRVGAVSVPLATAERWVSEYTSLNNASVANPYAYPAYDRYEGERNDPRVLTDADLLAPGLLNVPVKIRSYYDLQRVRSALEDGLANDDLCVPLAEVDDPTRVAAMVKPLYAILDDPQTRPWNVSATTLSKVLQRKRPESLVLHDKWVNACYVGGTTFRPRTPGRSCERTQGKSTALSRNRTRRLLASMVSLRNGDREGMSCPVSGSPREGVVETQRGLAGHRVRGPGRGAPRGCMFPSLDAA